MEGSEAAHLSIRVPFSFVLIPIIVNNLVIPGSHPCKVNSTPRRKSCPILSFFHLCVLGSRTERNFSARIRMANTFQYFCHSQENFLGRATKRESVGFLSG